MKSSIQSELWWLLALSSNIINLIIFLLLYDVPGEAYLTVPGTVAVGFQLNTLLTHLASA